MFTFFEGRSGGFINDVYGRKFSQITPNKQDNTLCHNSSDLRSVLYASFLQTLILILAYGLRVLPVCEFLVVAGIQSQGHSKLIHRTR